jgi:putative SOS response-associated peptidase YedK
MCYSAQILSDYRRYSKEYGATLSIREFVELFWHRQRDPRTKIPKAMESAFLHPTNASEQEIKRLVDEFAADQETKLQQELFKQKKRLADAERMLMTKLTKKAQDEQRIATSKIEWCLGKISDLHRTELIDDDSRIYPGHYAPVMVWEEGRRVMKPMRYQCRPAGKPAFYDVKYPGTYNARRDNLGGFWKELFGFSHGLVVMNAFFENVNKHRAQGRELHEGEAVENVILEFRPRPQQDMLVACLWSKWVSAEGEELLSFAAITDEPPPEVVAAGHDRCVVPLKEENIDAWLRPDRDRIRDQYAILDDRARPFYEHRWLEAA